MSIEFYTFKKGRAGENTAYLVQMEIVLNELESAVPTSHTELNKIRSTLNQCATHWT